MFETIEEARAELDLMLSDAQSDFPDVSECDIHHDMVQSLVHMCTPEVAREICRTELGWVPDWCPR